MWCVGCGVRDVVCGMWCEGCGVWDVVCGMWCDGYGVTKILYLFLVNIIQQTVDDCK